jgi:hypothetical protein
VRIIACPKCRMLGLGTSCTDQWGHGRKPIHVGASVSSGRSDTEEPETYELDVTLTFAVPVTSSLDLDPHQMATHMLETWSNDPTLLLEVVKDAMYEDFDLKVAPALFVQ